MRRFRTLLFYVLLVVVTVVVFSPKRQLYYFGESLLKPYGVVLSGERVVDNGLSLSLEDGVLYFQDLKIAQLESVTLRPMILFNTIDIVPFSVAEDIQRFVPGTITMKIYHSVIDPIHIHLEGTGTFGSIGGTVDLWRHKIALTLMPSKTLMESRPSWLKEMKKQPSGEYLYEVNY